MLTRPRATICVSSGRGEWLYWKLSDPISKAKFERVNRLLPRIAGSSDKGSWTPEHWARLPGSANEKTGEIAYVCPLSEHRYQSNLLIAEIESAAIELGIHFPNPGGTEIFESAPILPICHGIQGAEDQPAIRP